MRKGFTAVICIFMVMVIMAGMLLMHGCNVAGGRVKKAEVIETANADASDREVIELAQRILSAIAEKDYRALASAAHTEYGVVFSPYATVDLTTSCCFTPSQIAAFEGDDAKYIWGVYDGSGEPIEMTPAEYFEDFVFDTDFTKCENFGVDEILRAGNSLENITEVFKGCRFVDCYMPDTENGESWVSLRFVFEEQDEVLKLSAIVHSENTI